MRKPQKVCQQMLVREGEKMKCKVRLIEPGAEDNENRSDDC
jgi:hypothetical protein